MATEERFNLEEPAPEAGDAAEPVLRTAAQRIHNTDGVQALLSRLMLAETRRERGLVDYREAEVEIAGLQQLLDALPRRMSRDADRALAQLVSEAAANRATRGPR